MSASPFTADDLHRKSMSSPLNSTKQEIIRRFDEIIMTRHANGAEDAFYDLPGICQGSNMSPKDVQMILGYELIKHYERRQFTVGIRVLPDGPRIIVRWKNEISQIVRNEMLDIIKNHMEK
jgi:hypothetical protein